MASMMTVMMVMGMLRRWRRPRDYGGMCHGFLLFSFSLNKCIFYFTEFTAMAAAVTMVVRRPQ